MLLVGALLNLGEEVADFILMNGCLRDALCNDRRLLPLDAKHELDEGVQKSSKQTTKKVVSNGVAIITEEVLLQHGLGALFLELSLEEAQEIAKHILDHDVVVNHNEELALPKEKLQELHKAKQQAAEA